MPRVRDRKPGTDRITFTPSILPRYLRKARSVEEVLAWLYLKGLSSGDFSEALAALPGLNAKGLSATTITGLKSDRWSEYEVWEKRDLGARRFFCIRADGVSFKPWMAEEKQCALVIVGADEYGRKELLAMTDGFRESPRSWREVRRDLRRRGLKQDPKPAIGDGTLGFRTALREVFPTTREQRCWLHKNHERAERHAGIRSGQGEGAPRRLITRHQPLSISPSDRRSSASRRQTRPDAAAASPHTTPIVSIIR